MGKKYLDQFALLHFATGVIAYFHGLSLRTWLILHTAFEISENTEIGMKLINKFKYWPGGKTHADSLKNNIGDSVSAGFGWLFANELDKIGKERNWAEPLNKTDGFL